MSRIGNKEILIPAGVTIIQNGQTLEVTGPKGKMEYTFDENVAINIHDNKIKITRHGDEKYQRAIHNVNHISVYQVLNADCMVLTQDVVSHYEEVLK
jgi:large subunit ribosomal protein L6